MTKKDEGKEEDDDDEDESYKDAEPPNPRVTLPLKAADISSRDDGGALGFLETRHLSADAMEENPWEPQ